MAIKKYSYVGCDTGPFALRCGSDADGPAHTSRGWALWLADKRNSAADLSQSLSRKSGLLAANIAALIGSTSAVIAEVTFEEVEAALTALEAASTGAPQVLEEQLPPDETVAVTLPDVETTTDPATLLPPPDGGSRRGANETRVISGYEFLPILTDEACPFGLTEIREEVEEVEAYLVTVREEAQSLQERFSNLDEQDRDNRIDESVVECPAPFVRGVEDLLQDLQDFDLATEVQRVETLQFCAQEAVRTVNDRMTQLAPSSDRDDVNERSALGDVLRRLTTADTQLTEALDNIVFYDQRRERLILGAELVQGRCEVVGSY